jgi:hypothetical protein
MTRERRRGHNQSYGSCDSAILGGARALSDMVAQEMRGQWAGWRSHPVSSANPLRTHVPLETSLNHGVSILCGNFLRAAGFIHSAYLELSLS